MSTPIESPETNNRDRAPALLRTEGGEAAILPTQHLPGVDFGAHLRDDDGDDGPQHGQNDGAGDETQDPRSYFSEKPGEADGVTKPVKKSGTSPLPKIAPSPAALRRNNTAPAQDSRRPKAPARSSTLLRAMRRGRPDDDFPFTFDPMSSESEPSSSEDENPIERRTQARRRQRLNTPAERNEHEQTKQHAREGRSYSRFRMSNEYFKSKGRVSRRDGRLNISINETNTSGYLAKALGQTIKHHMDLPNRKRKSKQRQHAADHAADRPADVESLASSLNTASTPARPRLNVVIIVIGSRGDIQPFLQIGKLLKHQYGHRVRIATHPTFREFVEKEAQLEFFSVGGDPSELMAFMVKNPGLLPNLQTIREGEIPRRRRAMSEMFEGMWRACTSSSDEDEKDKKNAQMIQDQYPFVADAIIANPPSLAHVHIAERLGIPLHIMFTFPYSPTQAFPHPLANIRSGRSNVDANYVNFMSYPLVETMIWQGLGDIVNKFRKRSLGLEPVSSLWAPGALYRMKVPYTYMWSPSLIPKPSDWGPEIDVSGFVFMDMASSFQPPDDLSAFLDAGDPPVYIGFGSIVIDDPDAMTELIIEAVKMAGCRALVNKGWGGLGTTNENTPDNIFMLGNTPHDWLFPRCKAVIHHGGAGTTAIGLKCAKPTMIVPFFGDQPFWAARVAEAKAGAHEVIPWRRLTVEKFAEGIKQCLTEEAQQNVQTLADGIASEGDGAVNACRSFHRSLPLAGRTNMRCSILQDRVAKWIIKGSTLRLSALAAEILLQEGKIKTSDLKLFRAYSWNDFDGPGEPISGTVGAMADSIYDIGAGAGMVPVRMAKHMKKRAEHEHKKREIQRRKERRRDDKRQQKVAKAVAANTAQTTASPRPGASRVPTTNTLDSTLSADPTTPLAAEVARDIREGIIRSGGALLTMPNDLHVALAQGFHNAPRLWGDVTVRKPIRITGFRTGCTAARREMAYGFYDGWTGIVTQPYGGVMDGDTIPAKVAGFGTGVGKGVGGFVLKNISAIISPPAYIAKGVIVYVKKRRAADGPGSKSFLRRAHLIQGYRDLWTLRQQQKDDPLQQGQLLVQLERQVHEGWRTYEEIWRAAQHRFGAGNAHVPGLASIRFRREKKRWIETGAVENVQTAQQALHAQRRGAPDLDSHLARRQRAAERAEEPRAPAMQPQPQPHEPARHSRAPLAPPLPPPSSSAAAATAEAAAPEHVLYDGDEEEEDDDDDQARDEERSDGTLVGSDDAEDQNDHREDQHQHLQHQHQHQHKRPQEEQEEQQQPPFHKIPDLPLTAALPQQQLQQLQQLQHKQQRPLEGLTRLTTA